MIAFRHKIIGAGLAAFGTTGLHRLAAPFTRGRGAILTFHHVRSASPDSFAPNKLLEITPAFLEQLLEHAAQRGYRFVRLDQIPQLLTGTDETLFLALTFDDGYRDTLAEALPILERHQAPFTVFATTGFLDRTARLWWVELELSLQKLASVRVTIDGASQVLRTGSAREKSSAYARLRRRLLQGSDEHLLAGVTALTTQAGVWATELVDRLCMDWTELARLARHPLATIGCHTLTHPRLARLSAARALDEIVGSKQRLEAELGQPVTTFCYPYGMASAAGPREFASAREAGFTVAVTTRPGTLTAADAQRMTALPRISVNGLWQDVAAIDVLLSGVPFPLWRPLERLSATARAIRSGPAAPSTG